MSCDAVGTVRDPFWNILGQEAAGAFFCGHDHIYARGVAQDTAGNWVRQVIIGNGGAPAPANFYAGPLVPNYMTLDGVDPFIESAARFGAASPVGSYSPFCCPTGTPTACSPMIFKEFFDQPYDAIGTDFGYVVVEIHGSMAQATYKARRSARISQEVLAFLLDLTSRKTPGPGSSLLRRRRSRRALPISAMRVEACPSDQFTDPAGCCLRLLNLSDRSG